MTSQSCAWSGAAGAWCGEIAADLDAYHGCCHGHPVIQRCCEPGVHATQAEAGHAYPGCIHIRPRCQVVQQDNDVPDIVQQKRMLRPLAPCSAEWCPDLRALYWHYVISW